MVRRIRFWGSTAANVILIWGRRPTTRRAVAFARRNQLSLLCLEDGFLRSMDLGHRSAPLSIVVDECGIYYDATVASTLELLAQRCLTDEETKRANRLVAKWRASCVSKYNHMREYVGDLSSPYVLVVDQTFDDASVRFGLADGKSFERMIDAALAEHPVCRILVKVHPDVVAGQKTGYLYPGHWQDNPRICIVAEPVHPVSLIEHATAVYVVTSQIGFEALIWGRPVRVFGMPFYAGWGLTKDEMVAPERRSPISLAQLVHAALVEYSRCVDPETGLRCEIERLLEWVGFQRRMRSRFAPLVYASDFSPWKKPIVRAFFQGSTVHFVRAATTAPSGATLAAWAGSATQKGLLAPELGTLVRIEDGFMRSVGLGAGLVRPVSWVQDATGIYYDSGNPSDLEILLQAGTWSKEVLDRAARLRSSLLMAEITKYNLTEGSWQAPDRCAQSGRSVILVPGQVESDASIRCGSPLIKTNMALLRAVRDRFPRDYVIYKPHPDVVGGYREAGLDEDQAQRWCDEVVTKVSIGPLLSQVDQVHTLTSLTGFEALLRGIRVVCYGQPFYSGWGLTLDYLPVARRTRRLSLDELVAGCLIEYPVYLSRRSGAFTSPERAIEELVQWRAEAPTVLSTLQRTLAWGVRASRRFFSVP